MQPMVADFLGNLKTSVQGPGKIRIESIRNMVYRKKTLGQRGGIHKAIPTHFLMHPLNNLFFCHSLFLQPGTPPGRNAIPDGTVLDLDLSGI